MVRKSTSAARRSSITCSTSLRSSPSPTMMPDLVKASVSISFTRCSSRIGAKYGAPGGDDHHGAVLAKEIGRQHFDCGRGAARADGADGRSEVRGSAIVEIVTI